MDATWMLVQEDTLQLPEGPAVLAPGFCHACPRARRGLIHTLLLRTWPCDTWTAVSERQCTATAPHPGHLRPCALGGAGPALQRPETHREQRHGHYMQRG